MLWAQAIPLFCSSITLSISTIEASVKFESTMSESDKQKIKPLTESADYSLWRMRIKAAFGSKGLSDTLESERQEDTDEFKKMKSQASNIIVSALSDAPLRIVRKVIGDPLQMLRKLDARYDSRTTASKISKMTELVSMKFSSMKSDVAVHIDKMAALIEQLRAMQTVIDESFAIAILVSSIEVSEFRLLTAAIKTLAESDLSWEAVSERLIEEHKRLNHDTPEWTNAATPNDSCAICHKLNHKTADCYLNPLNPKNRLGLDKDQIGKVNIRDGKSRRKEGKGRQNGKPHKGAFQRAAMAKPKIKEATDRMLLDSGTSSHMTPVSTKVRNRKTCHVDIMLGDDSKVTATCRGTRSVLWQAKTGPCTLSLSDTLVAKDLSMSLLSIPALVKKNIATLFLPGKALFIDLDNEFNILGVARQDKDGMFYIADRQEKSDSSDSSSEDENEALDVCAMMASINEETSSITEEEDVPKQKMKQSKPPCKVDAAAIWHQRLGHAVPVSVAKKEIQNGYFPIPRCDVTECTVCTKSKFHKRFSGSLTKEPNVGKLHADTKGQLEDTSIYGHKYFLTIVEECSRFVHVEPLKSKGEASAALLAFIRYFEKQSGFIIRKLHTDGGSEFSRVRRELKDKGLKITHSTAYTPQSNGLVERTHRSITSLARAALKQAKLPHSYWNFAVTYAADCKNLIRHSTTGNIPHNVVFQQPSRELAHMRPFGCRMLYQPVSPKLKTFKPRLEEGINMGHEDGGVYNVLTESGVVRTKHVRVFEMHFPGLKNRYVGDKSERASESLSDSSGNENSADSDSNFESEREECTADYDTENETSASKHDDITHYPAMPSKFGESESSDADDDIAQYDSAVDKEEATSSDSDISGEENRPQTGHVSSKGYNLRGRKLPRGSSTFRAVPNTLFDDSPNLSDALRSSERKKWLSGIQAEFATLVKAKTWEPIAYPKSSDTVLPSGIILKLKRDERGNPLRYKARVVARGNFQEHGESYVELYTPVACIDIVRILLAVAIACDWEIEHVDIKGAFLYAEIPKNVHIVIKLPKVSGVKEASGSYVRLKKSLYGLRQAPKLWYSHLAKVFERIGLRETKSGNCLFASVPSESKAPGMNVFVLIYVDDLLIVGKRHDVDEVKKRLAREFETTDLGRCTHFLGITVSHYDDGIRLTQTPFTERLIQFAGLEDAKPTSTPLPLGHPLYEKRVSLNDDERENMRQVPFRSILGSLLFLATITRPDISTAVSMLARYQDCPTERTSRAMKHLLRYLNGPSKMVLCMSSENADITLKVWSDADWARDHDSRKSRSGNLLTLGKTPVMWTSKLQTCAAQSTSEAEFNALSGTVRDLVWTRNILSDLGFSQKTPTVVFQDNLGAIKWTEDVHGLRNVKHVGIKFCFVRDIVKKRVLTVQYVPSTENKADGMTKVLIGQAFQQHRKYMGMS